MVREMRVLITDADYPSIDDVERPILEPAGFQVELAHCRTAEQVIQAGQGASVLLTQYAPVTRGVLEALPQVRLVCRYGVGVDNVDLKAAEDLGVWVANVPDYGVGEVATHALAMALALIRHLPMFDRQVQQGHWHYLGTGALHRPSTMTLGVLGHGRIGSRMAQLAAPSFGRVLACDPYIPNASIPENVRRVDHDELFSKSDVVSLHVPLTDETRKMVDRHRLAQMPEDSYLVNTARGGVVNLDDLLEALDSGRLSGAALDVLPEEPPPDAHPVLHHSRVLLSPHSAYFSVEAEEELRRKTAINVVDWVQQGRPTYVVVEA
jgi:D-3-phosphoglycerate dehydrogenase